MQLRIDGAGLLAATAVLTEHGVALRCLAAACESGANEVGDPRLRAAVRELTDAVGDALGLSGTDLALVAAKARAATRRYDDVELALAEDAAATAEPPAGTVSRR